MDARLFPNRKCGCTLEQAMFLIAIYRLLEAHRAQAQAIRA
jgi:hypothetical protein